MPVWHVRVAYQYGVSMSVCLHVVSVRDVKHECILSVCVVCACPSVDVCVHINVWVKLPAWGGYETNLIYRC